MEEPRGKIFCWISYLQTWNNQGDGQHWLKVMDFRILGEEDQGKK